MLLSLKGSGEYLIKQGEFNTSSFIQNGETTKAYTKPF